MKLHIIVYIEPCKIKVLFILKKKKIEHRIYPILIIPVFLTLFMSLSYLLLRQTNEHYYCATIGIIISKIFFALYCSIIGSDQFISLSY